MIRRVVLLANLFVVLATVGLAVRQKEVTLRDGTVVLLRLRPVDPRSLIQGDYMALAYALHDSMANADPESAQPRDGRVIVRETPDEGATFVRFDTGAPLAAGEIALRYRTREGAARVGTDAYYFEEGQAERFEAARYAELRVDSAGNSVLVNMLDEGRKPLGVGIR